jgi:hypothetical protein
MESVGKENSAGTQDEQLALFYPGRVEEMKKQIAK